MFQPGAPGLIPIAMVMSMVKNAIKESIFSQALADHMGSILPWYIKFIHLKYCWHGIKPELEDLTVQKRSPDLLNNIKIGQDQLWLKMKHFLFYGGCGHFGQVT